MLFNFDSTGLAPNNLIINEEHTVNAANGTNLNYIVPRNAPFFDTSMVVIDKTTGTILVENTDYVITYPFALGFSEVGKPLSGSISFTNTTLTGTFVLRYQTLGGDFVTATTQAITNGIDTLAALQNTAWDVLVQLPETFPTTPHNHTVSGIDGMAEIIDEVIRMREAFENPNTLIHLSDVEDLKGGFVDPLLGKLVDIAAAIRARSTSANLFFEQSTPGAVTTSLGALADGVWTDTPLSVTPKLDGTYKVDISVVPNANTIEPHRVDVRYTVNDLALDKSYNIGGVIGLSTEDRVTVQVRIVGTTSPDFKIAGADHSSVLLITRLGT